MRKVVALSIPLLIIFIVSLILVNKAFANHGGFTSLWDDSTRRLSASQTLRRINDVKATIPIPTRVIITPTSTPTPSTPSPTSIPLPIPTSTSVPLQTSAPIPTSTPIPTAQPTAIPVQQPTGDQGITDYIMNEINNYRKSKGLSAVSTNSYTCSFAGIRAKEISSGFNHDGFTNRINSKTLPYPSYSLITENLAMTSNYKNVVNMWINSAGHAANMQKNTPYVCVENYGDYYAYEGWKP